MVFIKTVVLAAVCLVVALLVSVSAIGYRRLPNYVQARLDYYWYFVPSQEPVERMFYAATWFAIIWNCIVYNALACYGHVSHFVTNWILSTNHRRIAIMYFVFTIITGFSGLILATIIRIELAYTGQVVLLGNAEKYLTIVSLHGLIMVFFVVIPILFGAFANFLLPTQLGIRDVAFPRLNSFMFWITPAGFVMLLHILLFDKSYSLTYWLNYSELRAQLRRRYSTVSSQDLEYHLQSDASLLALRLASSTGKFERARNFQSAEHLLHTNEVGLTSWDFGGVLALLSATKFLAFGNYVFAAVTTGVVSCFYEISLAFGGLAAWVRSIVLLPLCPYDFVLFLFSPRLIFRQLCLDWSGLLANLVSAALANHNINLRHQSFLNCDARLLASLFADMVYSRCGAADSTALVSGVVSFVFGGRGIVVASRSVVNFLDWKSCRVGFLDVACGDSIVWYTRCGFFSQFCDLLSSHSAVTYSLSRVITTFGFGDGLSAFNKSLASSRYFCMVDWQGRASVDSLVLDLLSGDQFFGGASRWLSRQSDWLQFSYAPQSQVLSDWRYSTAFIGLVLRAAAFDWLSLVVSGYAQGGAAFTLFLRDVTPVFSLTNIFSGVVVNRSFYCDFLDSYLTTIITWVLTSHSSCVDLPRGVVSPQVVGGAVISNTTTALWGHVTLADLLTASLITNSSIGGWYAAFTSGSDSYVYFLAQKPVGHITGAAAACGRATTAARYNLLMAGSDSFNAYATQLAARYFVARYSHFSPSLLAAFVVYPGTGVTGCLATAVSVNCGNVSSGVCSARLMLQQYCHLVGNLDYLNDWRGLKLEREIWRSVDDFSAARKHWLFRKKYYSNFYEPSSLINKVSIWMPNHLIPGWAFITPYTSRLRYTSLGKVDVALVVALLASLGSVFSAINYVITYRYVGAPILKNRKELRSFYVDALLVGSRMMIVANPALIIGILLLLSDRHLHTSVFDFSGGGDTILFQHLFWFFGHPEVYIVIIPCFGIMNSLLPYYLRKRLSGRLSLQFSMYTIAFMGFVVWGHHMYMVGLANSVRTLYSTGTVMISVPASTKILHWCVTLIQSSLSCDVGFLFLLAFMYFFVLGGLSGMFVAHLGFDVIFHDTFYVVGHFHVMFACASMSCIFAAFYFYFAAIFGVRYSRFFAYLHFFFFVIGQLITIVPMMWLGYAGMPRRIMDYPTAFAGWHSIISSGHLLIVLSFIFFFCMLFDSLYENRAPVSKTKGVSRLNTRLGFYAYEIRKLKFYRSKSLFLSRRAAPHQRPELALYQLCYESEMVHFEYIFGDLLPDSGSTAPMQQSL